MTPDSSAGILNRSNGNIVLSLALTRHPLQSKFCKGPVGLPHLYVLRFRGSASYRGYPAIPARKLSIARLSGNTAGALAFVEVSRAAFERRFFRMASLAGPHCPDKATILTAHATFLG
jgi:hypothetical protein